MATLSKIQAHTLVSIEDGSYHLNCERTRDNEWNGMFSSFTGGEGQQVQHSFVAALERFGLEAEIFRVRGDWWKFRFHLSTTEDYVALTKAFARKVGLSSPIGHFFQLAFTVLGHEVWLSSSPGSWLWVGGGRVAQTHYGPVLEALLKSELCGSAKLYSADNTVIDGIIFTLREKTDLLERLGKIAEIIASFPE